jgi:hypothetical protein
MLLHGLAFALSGARARTKPEQLARSLSAWLSEAGPIKPYIHAILFQGDVLNSRFIQTRLLDIW